MEFFYYLITAAIYSAPELVIIGVGIILALVNRKRIGKPAILALIGCALLFVNACVKILQSASVFFFAANHDTGTIGSISFIGTLAGSFLWIVGIIFLFAAIFIKRE